MAHEDYLCYDEQMRRNLTCLILFLIFYESQLLALDLLEACKKAKANDPQYLQSLHEYGAALTYPYQAISRLLPQASLSRTDVSYDFLKGPWYYVDYRAVETTVNLQQTLFNYPLFLEIRDSRLRKKIGELRLKYSELDLLRRVSEAYFDVLFAQDTLKVVTQEKKALEEQLKMIEKLFKAGEASLADLNDVEARLRTSEFRIVDATRSLSTKSRNLERIIGEKFSSLSPLKKDPSEEKITPDDLEPWLKMGRERNPVVLSYDIQKEMAENAFRKQRGQRLPTATLFAKYSRTEETTYTKIEPLTYKAVGIQFSLPLFTGGYITAREMELKERVKQAEKEYERVLSDTEQAIVESFLSARSSLSAIEAGRTSVKAAEIALESTRKGYHAGLRTVVDILNAESNLYRAKLDLLKVTYDFVKSLIALNFYSGTLTESVIIGINSYLEAD